jgi:hypothetical protein
VQVKDSGIRCITTPCPVLREEKLNSTTSTSIGQVNYPTEDLSAEAGDLVFGGSPVIVIGYRSYNGSERRRDANAVFFRVGQ